MTEMRTDDEPIRSEEALWERVLAHQGETFYTLRGLPFSYTVKQGKRGRQTGELLITRKENSKTLTKSSLMLALHVVLDAEKTAEEKPFFQGPKAIGQIFGISYIYSLFWKWGLIAVPDKTAERMSGGI